MERLVVRLNNDESNIRSSNRLVILGHRKKLRVSRRLKIGGDAKRLGSAPRRQVGWALWRYYRIRQRRWLLQVDTVGFDNGGNALGSCSGDVENLLYVFFFFFSEPGSGANKKNTIWFNIVVCYSSHKEGYT
ncbi:hypothetical protein L3X38_025274 [Prunus dulcis]|uniref:Uncharacterized protein n=1 Tax=Prunus dulcis TaxID=3755 RepID=A0AAD4W265_PRUDU|nr:hypothetical protein L3X38_025274 [Prunus dulcis]